MPRKTWSQFERGFLGRVASGFVLAAAGCDWPRAWLHYLAVVATKLSRLRNRVRGLIHAIMQTAEALNGDTNVTDNSDVPGAYLNDNGIPMLPVMPTSSIVPTCSRSTTNTNRHQRLTLVPDDRRKSATIPTLTAHATGDANVNDKTDVRHRQYRRIYVR